MLEAAIRLLRTSGLSGAGINEIVRESGAPKGSVYHHFPDGKTQIAAEALALYASRVLSFLDTALAAGRTVLLEIDLQGARQVRAAEPTATLVFLLPPSWDELVQRLVGRGTEGDEERARRLRTAKGELAAQNEFDFRVVNDDVASAAREVVELVQAPARPF